MYGSHQNAIAQYTFAHIHRIKVRRRTSTINFVDCSHITTYTLYLLTSFISEISTELSSTNAHRSEPTKRERDVDIKKCRMHEHDQHDRMHSHSHFQCIEDNNAWQM